MRCGQEMAENLEVFREVWSMHLSATRNRIIRINLVVTVASFALSICIVPASFFGMNLPHGLEARLSITNTLRMLVRRGEARCPELKPAWHARSRWAYAEAHESACWSWACSRSSRSGDLLPVCVGSRCSKVPWQPWPTDHIAFCL